MELVDLQKRIEAQLTIIALGIPNSLLPSAFIRNTCRTSTCFKTFSQMRSAALLDGAQAKTLTLGLFCKTCPPGRMLKLVKSNQ